MPRRKSMPLEEVKSHRHHQPHSRHPHSSNINPGYGEGLYAGAGLYAGSGLYAGNGLYAGTGLVRNHKTLMGHKLVGLPPALQSQPYSTHYQWGVTLPPAYQHIAKGNGLY